MTEKTYPPPSSGLPGLDAMLTGVRPGDNIVWQIDSITDDYLPFVYPYRSFAHQHDIPLIYFHFSNYPRLVPEDDKTQVYNLNPEVGFERFVTEILDVIDRNGYGSYYIFDCLSELVVDWYSERMLGNFFRLVCPYLYKFDTIAYFAILKNRHITDAITAIHSTAQVILEVFRDQNSIYLQPFKVDGRYSPTMYMLHQWENNAFPPVISSSQVTRIMARVPQTWLDFTVQRIDVWPKTFLKAQTILDDVQQGNRPHHDTEYYFHRLLRMAFTHDERFARLAEKYLELQDLLQIRKRMIGTGLIGGKAAGMLLARRILQKTDKRWRSLLEDHDSFFIGSNVFYAFLIQNKCWDIIRSQRNMDVFLATAEDARQRIMAGRFSAYIINQFREMLNYFGQSPIIVRSSSMLEDAYGNAFSGKYDSVFCANQGTPSERLTGFINAVRTVYASTISSQALRYREQRGLLAQSEQMAILVQRVSGNIQDRMFFPHLAGVGFSFNPFTWNQAIDPRAGMIRLVFGLGTRAVDRRDDDYTRIVALNAPSLRPESTSEEKQKYTQHRVDILDLVENRHKMVDFSEVVRDDTAFPLELIASRDPEIERMTREERYRHICPWRVDFDKLFTGTSFIKDARAMLESLETAYEYPVDIEFTVNFMPDGEYRINLVQCRPFQVKKFNVQVKPPASIPDDKILLRTAGPIIGNSLAVQLDYLVYVVPAVYGHLNQSDRYSVARLIGKLTHTPDLKDRTVMLVGPGRWGTTTPSLGVPVKFAEINTVSVLCELVTMREDLIPDVSLGTHFFNDLVELDMLYMAQFPDKPESVCNDGFVRSCSNRLAAILPDEAGWEHAVHVVDCRDLPGGESLHLYVNSIEQQATAYLK